MCVCVCVWGEEHLCTLCVCVCVFCVQISVFYLTFTGNVLKFLCLSCGRECRLLSFNCIIGLIIIVC